MIKLLFVRLTGALGVTALALLFVGLIPFLGIYPTEGAGLNAKIPAVSVDRTLKGDRLPLPSDINQAVSRGDSIARPRSRMPQTPEDIPAGCDASFSPISSPRLAYYYGRCVT
jgi:hypothetical protein